MKLMRCFRSCFALSALCLALAAGARAQDVRITEFPDGQNGISLAQHLGEIRFIWTEYWEFCSGSIHGVMRTSDLQGRFTSPDIWADPLCSGFEPRDIAVSTSGEFLLLSSLGIGVDLVGRLFDPTGNPITGEFIVNEYIGGREIYGHVVAHPNGTFVVVWDEEFRIGVYGRIVLPDGSMPAGEVQLSASPPGTQREARVAVFSSGEVVTAWTDGSLPSIGLVQRRFDSALVPLGPEIPVASPGSIGLPTLAANGSMGIVSWDQGIVDSDVYAQLFSQSGGLQGTAFLVNTTLPQSQGGPKAAVDDLGRSVIIWSGWDGASNGVFGQRFDAQGNKIGGEFQVNMTTINPQAPDGIALLPGGDFFTAMTSASDTNTDASMFFRRFFFPVSLAVGPGPASTNLPTLGTRRPDGQPSPWSDVAAYGAAGYGLSVGAGDVDGDPMDEMLTGPGPSPVYGPQARAFNADSGPIQKINYYAYGTLRYGVKSGGANLDADAFSEIVTTPGPGAVFGPHVRGWNFDNTTLTAISKVSFFAYNTLKYGANASRGAMDTDAYDEVLTAPGPGVVFTAQIRGFNVDGGTPTAIGKINFLAFTGTNYGARVGAADIESDGTGGYGDGYDEILAGKGPSQAYDSELRVYDTDGGAPSLKFQVTPFTTTYGVSVAGGDVDAGDTEEIVTSPGPDPAASTRILCWEMNPALGMSPTDTLQTIGTDDFVAFPGLTYGANVAVGTFE